MALFKCSECGNDISIDAKSCPNCGANKPFKNETLSTEEAKKYSYGQIRNFQKRGGTVKTGKIAKIIGMVILIGILVMILKPSAPLTPEEQQEKLKSEAQSSCRYYIEKRLKDPDSAEKTGASVMRFEDGTYRVLYGIRAKNSFGAYVQGSFLCVLKRSGDNFELISINEEK